MRRGVPGLSLRTVMEHYFDWHHTQADMLDKVDPVELRKNVAALAVMVFVIADMPETLPRDRAPAARAAPGPPARARADPGSAGRGARSLGVRCCFPRASIVGAEIAASWERRGESGLPRIDLTAARG